MQLQDSQAAEQTAQWDAALLCMLAHDHHIHTLDVIYKYTLYALP